MPKKIKSRSRTVISSKNRIGKAVVLHQDPSGIRRDHIRAYKKLGAALRDANKTLRDLEEQDLPAFRRWYTAEFAKDHESVTVLHNRYEELDFIYGATEDYRLYVGCTYKQAYKKVSEAHAEGKLLELMRETCIAVDDEFEDEDDDDEDFWEEDIHSGGDPNDDVFGDESDDFFREFDRDHSNAPPSSRQKVTSHTDTDRHYKTLYRQLLRKLHPDFHPNQSAEEKSLWHELQDAYEWRDIGRLEKINQKLNGAAAVGLDLWAIPIGDIFAMTADLKIKLKTVTRDISLGKRSEYWDFIQRSAQKTYLSNLAKKIRKKIHYEAESLRFMLLELENQLCRWKGPEKKPKPKVPVKKAKTKPNKKRTSAKSSQPPKSKSVWKDYASKR